MRRKTTNEKMNKEEDMNNPEMHTEFLWEIRGNETYREAETQMGE